MARISSEPTSLAEIVKGLVVLAFRNGPLEDIHAGKWCPHCASDPTISHITNPEMAALMRYAVGMLYGLLKLREEDETTFNVVTTSWAKMFASEWDAPTEDTWRDFLHSLAQEHIRDFVS